MTELAEKLAHAVRSIPDFPKPGIMFRDFTPVLADPILLKEALKALASPFEDRRITKVIGIESRGFIFGGMLADYFGVGFVPVRKHGKLPGSTFQQSYDLEYGSAIVEMHRDVLVPGDRVLIHDDLIATGGTAAATGRLVKEAGGIVAGCSFLIELKALNGRKTLEDYFLSSILEY